MDTWDNHNWDNQLAHFNSISYTQVDAADTAYDALNANLDKQSLGSRFTTKVSFLLTLGHGLTMFREDFCYGGAMATILGECNGALALATRM
ncbi:hypothetical protein COL940_011196 [Colletotrichum noveboracense]|nr:hypothetical protein COL940_011196 [Colletotrichum noveboracense]KAJ0276822.1 hypothetical protein CBS470a_010613 [Colletotrichum nupharicola]